MTLLCASVYICFHGGKMGNGDWQREKGLVPQRQALRQGLYLHCSLVEDSALCFRRLGSIEELLIPWADGQMAAQRRLWGALRPCDRVGFPSYRFQRKEQFMTQSWWVVHSAAQACSQTVPDFPAWVGWGRNVWPSLKNVGAVARRGTSVKVCPSQWWLQPEPPDFLGKVRLNYNTCSSPRIRAPGASVKQCQLQWQALSFLESICEKEAVAVGMAWLAPSLKHI